jgi:hypothetical protein
MGTGVPSKTILRKRAGAAVEQRSCSRYADLSFLIASGLLTWIRYVAGEPSSSGLVLFPSGNHACSLRPQKRWSYRSPLIALRRVVICWSIGT